MTSTLTRYFLDPTDSVLLIVDAQDRLLQAFSEDSRVKIIKNARILAQSAQIMDVPIIVTEQYPAGLGHTVSELLEVLPAGQKVHEKLDFSCYRSTGFSSILSDFGRKSIILLGVEAHICVLQTAIDLVNAGYLIHVAADAVGSRTNSNCEVGLSMMRDNQTVISSTETIVFQWLKRAGSDAFKKISRLVR
ncbi:MAG: isochorismatase family protein [Myxococcales bacterium]|nr:isochorismatase family protein [Myxococcales bacterium]